MMGLIMITVLSLLLVASDLRHTQEYFTYSMTARFFGGGNRCARGKPPTFGEYTTYFPTCNTPSYDQGSIGTRAMNATASAACHGNPGMQETSNYVFCQPELNICVEEVRFYEHIKTASCPDSEISSPKPECCQVQDQQCYWRANYTVVQKIHHACNETRSIYGQCMLPAGNSRPPPTSSLCSNSSSIRVVLFTCRDADLPPTTDVQTQKPEAAEINFKTPAFIGGSVAACISLMIVVAVIVLTYRDRR